MQSGLSPLRRARPPASIQTGSRASRRWRPAARGGGIRPLRPGGGGLRRRRAPFGPARLCVPCPLAFIRTWSDGLPQAARDALILPLVPRLVGTRGSEALERRRGALAADWLVRTHLPAWFRLAKLNVEGDALANRPALTDSADLAAWCDHLEQARQRAKVANLTLRQTGAAVRAAVWDAAQQAAWAVIRDDLEAAGPRMLAAGWDAAYAAAYAAARPTGKRRWSRPGGRSRTPPWPWSSG